MELVNLVPKGVSGASIGGPLSAFSWNNLPCREPKVFLRAEESPIWASSASIGDSLLIVLINCADKLIETTKFSDGRQAVYDLDAPMTVHEFFVDMNARLINYANKRTFFKIEHEDRDDLLQSVFTKVWKSKGDEILEYHEIPANKISYFRSLHYTATMHALIDKWRKENPTETNLTPEEQVARGWKEYEKRAPEEPSVKPDEYRGVTCYKKIYESIGDPCMKVLELKEILGFGYADIAEQISEETGKVFKKNSVGTTLSRCRKLVREAKQEYCPELSSIGEMI